ncbi:hypothetical protein [Streptomyces sp. NRRL S-495]|uniref:hypothetical protein n=1 Tax=Streptomyces sp. NRRL S-495 TaxID=1609133 RepID=UPI000A3EDE82|nr:hypothetical protein [Streptomyces sp. NRRL S-495]
MLPPARAPPPVPAAPRCSRPVLARLPAAPVLLPPGPVPPGVTLATSGGHEVEIS